MSRQEQRGGGDGGHETTATTLSEHIDQNIESIVALQRREWEHTSVSQRRVERLSRFVGRPVFLIALLFVVIVWVILNVSATKLGFAPFDPLPFNLLEGILTLIALVVTTIVLIAQNRQTKLEQQHTHLGLQLTLLTEQKVTKLIHLIEELRADLPMVKNRHDPQTEALKEPVDTSEMISAIRETGLTDEAETPGE